MTKGPIKRLSNIQVQELLSQNNGLRVLVGCMDNVRKEMENYKADRSPERKQKFTDAVEAWDICRKGTKT